MKTSPASPAPNALLVHDGELADVCALLEALGTPFVERIGGAIDADCGARWDLVIASPKRILELQLEPTGFPTTQIAILAQDSRTLRNSLRRSGIQLMVRRPVHPATLRALVVHALYRGPEKRRSARVKVGAPVRLRVGWRQRPAILVDLSVGGCRLVTEQCIERGKSFRLHIPPSISGGKTVAVKARALTSAPDREKTAGRFITSARFEHVGRDLQAQLKAAVAAHTDGPAVYQDAERAPAAPVPASETRSLPPTAAPPPAAVAAETFPEPTAENSFAPAAAVSDGEILLDDAIALPERRESDRRALDQRVIALGEEAARVLMGRDISIGGMRVSPNPLLEVGMNLQLAVHTGNRDEPLIVRARVHRNDGERGMVLRFHELSADASRYLNDVMDDLPLVDVDANGQGCLVTEVLAAS